MPRRRPWRPPPGTPPPTGPAPTRRRRTPRPRPPAPAGHHRRPSSWVTDLRGARRIGGEGRQARHAFGLLAGLDPGRAGVLRQLPVDHEADPLPDVDRVVAD